MLAFKDAFPTCLMIVTVVKAQCKQQRSCW